MKSSNIRAIAAAFAFAAAALAPQAQAASMLNTPVPASLIVNAGNMEWVYASPCAGAGADSCDVVQLSNGFNFASDAQWNASFTSIAQLSAAFSNKCAAAYFSTRYNHCDVSNLDGGYIWHSPLAPTLAQRNWAYGETFLVRGQLAEVPEPASLALLGLGLVGLVAARRRKSRAA